MIESNILDEQAVAYLNQLEAAKKQEAIQLGRAGARAELLSFCVNWYDVASTWRKQSYEADWIAFQRNADGRYDPALKNQKKDWQAKAFVDLTPTHRETIHAELFRLVNGSRPILDVTAGPGGDPIQAENIRDLQVRELEKSEFEVHHDRILEDADTYGSGIARVRWEEKVEDRIVRQPIPEPISPLRDPASVIRAMRGQRRIVGYQNVSQPRVLYRGVRLEHVSIWDFFPDPKALKIEGSPCVERSWITLGEVIDGIKKGYYMPEAGMILREQASTEAQPADKSQLQSERGISDQAPRRLDYQRRFEYYCFYGRLPQKLVYPLLTEPLPIDEADKLVPAKVIFHKSTILAVELNTSYRGEPPFEKLDYFPVNGRFYARGIPEMLRNPQQIVNEVVCQRLDEGNLALQEGVAVFEKALVNPEDLLSGGPGMVLRIDKKAIGPNGDVRNAIFPLGRPDVKINAGFTEVHEWERMAEGRTSANRVVVGNADRYQGANRTLGGQQLLKQTAGEKFAYIAMLQEFTWLKRILRAYWELIYSNAKAEDIVAALGMERAQTFQLMTPEEIELSYKYEPKGIFEREAKATLQARLAALHEQFKGAPWIDNLAFFDQEAKSFNLDPARLKVPQAEAMEIQAKAQMMAEPMAKQMVAQIILGQAAKDVERNLAEKIADERDGAKPEKVEKVPDIAKPLSEKQAEKI